MKYFCIKQELFNEYIGTYQSYGIEAYNDKISVCFVSDISTNQKLVENLANICTINNLSFSHIYDVIEDLLNT